MLYWNDKLKMLIQVVIRLVVITLICIGLARGSALFLNLLLKILH